MANETFLDVATRVKDSAGKVFGYLTADESMIVVNRVAMEGSRKHPLQVIQDISTSDAFAIALDFTASQGSPVVRIRT